MWNCCSCFKWSLFQVNRINAVIPLCRTAFPSLITALSHFLPHQVIDTPDVFSLGEDDAGAELMFREWEQLIVSPGPTAIIFTFASTFASLPTTTSCTSATGNCCPNPLRTTSSWASPGSTTCLDPSKTRSLSAA